MAPTPSRIAHLHGRPTATPIAPLLSATTCVWSVEGEPLATDRSAAISKLSSIHNADLDREMERRWLDEDYDFYAPEEVARRNELYEAFARRVAALQSGDAGLGGRTDVDEYIERDAEEITETRYKTVQTKPLVPKSRIPKPTASVSLSKEQATEPHAIDSKTRVAQVPAATEPKALREHPEKNTVGTAEPLVVSNLPPASSSPSLSEIQRQELEMVKAYLAKLAADFKWESTASQGLAPTSEDCVIGLSAYVIAFGFQKALKHICGVLSLESPFEAKPTAMDDASDGPRSKGFSRKVEKGVLCTPSRRSDSPPDAVLNKSREALIEELQRMKMESATSEAAA